MTKDFTLLASGREDYNDFINWLQDHNWCKVTYCEHCQEWTPADKSRTYGRCWQYEGVIKYHDDYCSEAKEDTNEL